MTKRIGIVAPPGRGHLYPATTLGRRLRSEGFQVTVFDRSTSKAAVAISGLPFFQIDQVHSEPQYFWRDSPRLLGPNALNVLYSHASLILDNAPKAFVEAQIEALLVDQADLASGTVAELLGIPFLNLAMFPPLFLSDDSPPFIFPWKPDLSNRGILRNKRGNSFLERVTEPLKEEVNERRRKWGLPELAMLNDFFSEKGIITQLPQFLDFQRSAPPPSLAYTAPFYDGAGRPKINFPWSRLNGKPIAYASMGTARCGSQEVFELIASALSGSNFQLVMTLGGMNLTPSNISNVPDDAIVVHFAPQTELIKKASLCITHGGMNTVLDAVSNGVPLIIIPVTDDQPGVGARIEWVKAGLAIPFRQLTLQRLRDSITMVASTSHYREVVKEMERKLAHRDGVGEAARIVRERLA